MPAEPYTLFFKDISKEDLPLVGGKGANLGEMTQAGFPVPNGFATTVSAYNKFLVENNLDKQIDRFLAKIDVNQADELENASKSIQNLITTSCIPKDVAEEFRVAYKKLSGRYGQALVAVRSSATAEDLPEASFAGQQDTFLNIKGEASLLVAIRDCWASLFTSRAIFYRVQNKINHAQVKISVIVQQMIQSEVSGVMFTIDPVTNDKDRIVIESVWGLGELIVQGLVVPDKYVVQKDSFDILSKEISDQSVALVKVGRKNKKVKVSKKKRELQKLTNEEIVDLAKIADRLQKHYYFPQDIEWAKEVKTKGLRRKKEIKFFIVQTRPVTAIPSRGKKRKKEKTSLYKTTDKPVLTGAAASPGIGTGPVKVLKSPKEINKVTKGDILVAEMTSPDFVPAMKKAVAIVTDQGGMTSHAAIVSRELGIPCVVGTHYATINLTDGDVISVDGSRGLVFMGSKVRIEKRLISEKEEIIKSKTATKLYVNLAEPERANEIAKLNVDGVGLLRAEFMIADIGIHPKEAIKQKKQAMFVSKLSHDMSIFCKNFNPRPVVYRTTDFKTNEYRSLPGGINWEPEETNPMLGFRGAFRYITNPDVFCLELQAIKNVREKYKNLWIMIPFVRSPEELRKVRRIVASEGLFESPTFKFWMMVELPINVILINKFINVGIDGVSIGSNDLTMLIIGTDRDNAEVAEAFNERSPSVYWALKKVIKACNKRGVSSSICGQAPSSFEDLVINLVKYGITSISVNPDSINRVRSVIMEAEKEVAVGKRKK